MLFLNFRFLSSLYIIPLDIFHAEKLTCMYTWIFIYLFILSVNEICIKKSQIGSAKVHTMYIMTAKKCQKKEEKTKS